MADKPPKEPREKVTAETSIVLKFLMGNKAGKYRTPKDIGDEIKVFVASEEQRYNLVAREDLNLMRLLEVEEREAKKMTAKMARGAQTAVPVIEEAVQQCKEAIEAAANSIWKTLKNTKATVEEKATKVSTEVGKAFKAVGDFVGVVAGAVYEKIPVPKPIADFAKECKRRGNEFITKAKEIGKSVNLEGMKDRGMILGLQIKGKLAQAAAALGGAISKVGGHIETHAGATAQSTATSIQKRKVGNKGGSEL